MKPTRGNPCLRPDMSIWQEVYFVRSYWKKGRSVYCVDLKSYVKGDYQKSEFEIPYTKDSEELYDWLAAKTHINKYPLNPFVGTTRWLLLSSNV